MRIRLHGLSVAVAICAGVWFWTNSGYWSTPRDLHAFGSLQQRVRATSEKAIPAVVAVEQPGRFGGESRGDDHGYASGVIISADGLVLSQHHVSHRYFWDGEGAWRNRAAGELTTVWLADGRKVQAELLGADETHDLSLLQILEPGPFPFVPLEKNGVRVGDWVLEIGHPLGYQRERGAVVRLGRVLRCDKARFAADCNVTGGDSGGPILNLDGCLVGIPSTLFFKETFSADWRWGKQNWKKPASMTQPVTIIDATSASTVQQRLPDLAERKLLFDPKFSDEANQFMDPGPMLPHSDWTQGTRTTGSLKKILEPIRPSVVSIVGPDDQLVAMGIVVAADGLIVAVARTLPEAPRCRLANGDIEDACLVAVDETSRLALLSVQEIDLLPLSLAVHEKKLTTGTIVASLARSDSSDISICMGIVSVSPERSRNATDKSSLRYFECDVPLVPEQLGQPVVDLDGIVVGLMVETTLYGCKALAIDSVAKRVKLMQSALPPSAASVIDAHGDATSANHRMHGSGGGQSVLKSTSTPAAP